MKRLLGILLLSASVPSHAMERPERPAPTNIILRGADGQIVELPSALANKCTMLTHLQQDFSDETTFEMSNLTFAQLMFVKSYLEELEKDGADLDTKLNSMDIHRLIHGLSAANYLDLKPKKPIIKALTAKLFYQESCNYFLRTGTSRVQLPAELVTKIAKAYTKSSSCSYFLAKAQLLKHKDLPGTKNRLNDGISQVTQIRYNPQGNKLAMIFGDDNKVLIKDLDSKQFNKLEGHTDIIHQITWSPCGTRLASVSKDRTIKIWDAATSQCSKSQPVTSDKIWQLEWNPKNDSLAFAINNIIHLVDIPTGHDNDSCFHDCSYQFKLTDLKWDSTGLELASTAESSLQRIDMRSKQKTRNNLPCDTTCLAWNSNDNKDIAVGTHRGKIIITSMLTSAQNFASFDHNPQERIHGLAWHPYQSLIASATFKGGIKLWNPHSLQEEYSFAIDDLIKKITWHPNGSQLAVAAFGYAYFWDWHDKNLKKDLIRSMSLEQMCLQQAVYNNPESVDISAPQLQDTWNELHPDMQAALLNAIPYSQRLSSWLTHTFVSTIRHNIHLGCNPHADEPQKKHE